MTVGDHTRNVPVLSFIPQGPKVVRSGYCLLFSTLGLDLASLGCYPTQECGKFPLLVLSALSETIPKTLSWVSSTLAGHTDAKATCAVPYSAQVIPPGS